MDNRQIIFVAGRALLAALFILAGAAKLVGPAPFRAHMAAYGTPVVLLPGVAAFELAAGGALLVGYQTMAVAGALSAFCVLTAAVFHRGWSDRAERTLFFKDVAIAGALAMIAAN